MVDVEEKLTTVDSQTSLNASMGGDWAVKYNKSLSAEPLAGSQIGRRWNFTLDSSYGPINWKTNELDWELCYQHDTAEVCDDAQSLTSWLERVQPEGASQIDNYVNTLSSNITALQFSPRCMSVVLESQPTLMSKTA